MKTTKTDRRVANYNKTKSKLQSTKTEMKFEGSDFELFKNLVTHPKGETELEL